MPFGAMQATGGDFLGGLQERYQNANLKPGPALMGEPQINPAQKTALNMEKQIHDQLLDTSAVNVLRSAIFESALLGTGVVKGPFNFYKRIHKWERNDEESGYTFLTNGLFLVLSMFLFGIFTQTLLRLA